MTKNKGCIIALVTVCFIALLFLFLNSISVGAAEASEPSVFSSFVQIPFKSDLEVYSYFDKTVTTYKSSDYQRYAFYFTGNGLTFYFFHDDTQFTANETSTIYSSMPTVRVLMGVDGSSKGFNVSAPNVGYNSSTLFVRNFSLTVGDKEFFIRNVDDYFIPTIPTEPPTTKPIEPPTEKPSHESAGGFYGQDYIYPLLLLVFFSVVLGIFLKFGTRFSI